MFLPADIGNQALDAAGIDFTIGDLEEGSRPAQVLLRAYVQCRQQLLRAVHWDFARKQMPLTLLADASGQTQGVGTIVPQPWQYEYAYPPDCMKLRFVPWNRSSVNPAPPPGNISTPTQIPLMTGLAQQPQMGRLAPSRFLVGTDPTYAPQPGTDFDSAQGVSPAGVTVIMSNVQNALGVYTADMIYPQNWDALFRAAFVAYLASEIALPLAKDKKFGLQMRDSQIGVAKQKIMQARVSDGNETWSSSDISVDWMRARTTSGAWGGGLGGWTGWCGGDGPGLWWGGWDALSFANGSAF